MNQLPTAFLDIARFARQRHASDVHLNAGCTPVLRIDGVLQYARDCAWQAQWLQDVAREIWSATTPPADGGDLTTTIVTEDLGAMRVHVFRALGGPSIAVRLLDKEIPKLESLNLPPVIASFAKLERGLVIVAGPTGSGKSTTLAAIVDEINVTSSRRIITIEDPIEYRHQNRRSIVSQREIGADTPDIASAVRGALRSDPDVIVVGEVRDQEGIRSVLAAAVTGHLVLTTLHTGDAAQTIDRIVDAFDGNAARQVRCQLAGVLSGVVCQRLVRRSGGHGRRAVAEILVGTEAVKNIIRDAKSHQLRNLISTGKQYGMQTLEQHAGELLHSREIDTGAAETAGVAVQPERVA